MPRRPINKKRILLPDPIYNSITVHMLINRVLKSGKKSIAYRIVYNALKDIGETTGKNPVAIQIDLFGRNRSELVSGIGNSFG